MRIAVLGTRGFPDVQGGVEKHAEELYPRLVRLGCEVTVFTRTPYIPPERRLLEWQGVKFIHLWCPRKKSVEALTHTLLGIFKARGFSPDILHLHAIGPALLTPLAKTLGLKVVLTHHGPDYERAKWGKLAKWTLQQGERWGVNYSDRIIAISQGIKKQIKDKYKREAVFIPNGVTLPIPLPSGAELLKWDLAPRQYVFTACRFVPEKGLHNLIAAYKSIQNPSFKLVIAGDADHETEYSRQLKKSVNQTPGVVLTGFISGASLGELFTNAGLFVLPSYYEGLPIALLEALSYALPVLVSDIPQHREVPLAKNRYFETESVPALASALKENLAQGISGPEKQAYLSLVQQEYNWDKIAQKTLAVYQS